MREISGSYQPRNCFSDITKNKANLGMRNFSSEAIDNKTQFCYHFPISLNVLNLLFNFSSKASIAKRRDCLQSYNIFSFSCFIGISA